MSRFSLSPAPDPCCVRVCLWLADHHDATTNILLADIVDEETADFLRTEVSDGIIAPGYTPAALKILSAKKGGAFIVLQGDAEAIAASSGVEYREVGGAVFAQKRNDVQWGMEHMETVVTPGALTDAEKRDLVVASIACKYTQSNSVVYAINGQTVGVGAGQQSRVDCVKLAGRKVDTWWLRQHPKVQSLPFVPGTKRQDRVNARVAYIDGVAPGAASATVSTCWGFFVLLYISWTHSR